MDREIKVEVQDTFVDRVVSKKVDEYIDKILPPGVLDKLKNDKNGDKVVLNNDQRLAYALKIWRNNGWHDRRESMRWERELREDKRIKFHQLVDAINASSRKARSLLDSSGMELHDYQMPTDATILLPQVITTVVREAVEPLLVLTSLFRRIQFTAGEQITFPAVGAFTAEDLAPGQEYPERTLEYAGTVTAKIGKVGVAVRFTDEMLRFSMFDVMSLHLQAAGRAMARLKEEKVSDLITNQGTTIFDNDAPGSANRGYTTGRDAIGEGNGTLTLQDLFQMFADLMNAGFVPNTLLMNPMGWLIFAQNETLRSFGFANNGPLWGAIQGQPGLAPTFGGGGVNMHQSGGSAAANSPSEMTNATMWGPVPTLFPAPLSIVVSPFIGFDEANQATDIIMCDRNELGILVEDEPVMTESWDDPARDLTKTKMRERYGLAVDNEGHSIASALGVRIDRGFDWDNFSVEQSYPSTGLPAITGGF